MTFYEAALRVLESEGRPLHFLEITQKSITLNLLSHVGKTPEQTMLSRLAAMARRARDRRVCVTAKDTFALIEWGIPEDVEALSQTGIPEANPEEDLPPLRPVERHPEPRNDNVRASGRTERKGRREDEEGGRRRKKFPPIAEVVFEILSEASEPLRAEDIATRAREKELASDELGAERILTALLEDNQRRIDAGRRPQFALDKATRQISLERAGSPSEALPADLVAAFAEALGIPLEGGRPVLPSRPSATVGTGAGTPVAPLAEGSVEAALAAAKTAIKEYRRATAKVLRKRLSELEAGVLEKSVVKMLHAHGFRELKVAKRSKEGPLLTARRRDGSVELRYAVRILRGNPGLDRKEVKELKKDLQHYAAQVGLLCSAGEVRSDARGEAQQTQGGLVLLWCGDSLAEKFLDAQSAVKVTTVELFEIDEAFFAQARVDADEAAKRREERHRERAQREGGAPDRTGGDEDDERPEVPRRNERPAAAPAEELESAPAPAPAPQRAPAPVVEAADEGDDDEGEDGDDEGDDALDAASAFVAGSREGGQPADGQPGQPGERKRRRRRRRGRRGRGPRPEGAPGQPGGAEAGGGQPAQSATSAEGGAPEGAASSNGEGEGRGGSHPGGGEGSAEGGVPRDSGEAPRPVEASGNEGADTRRAEAEGGASSGGGEAAPAAPAPDSPGPSEGSTAGS